MGTTFQAIVMKTTNCSMDPMVQLCSEKGYEPCAKEEAELMVWTESLGSEFTLVAGDTAWITPEELSDTYQVPVLFLDCMDSDAVLYRLAMDSSNTTIAASGRFPEEMELPEIDSALWKAFTGVEMDYSSFFAKEYLFAEDGIIELLHAMGIQEDNLLIRLYGETPGPNACYVRSQPKKQEHSQLPSHPILKHYSYQSRPIKAEEPYYFSFMNEGASGRGVELWLSGPFVERDAMTFTEVYVTQNGKPIEGTFLGKRSHPSLGPLYAYRFESVELMDGTDLEQLRNHSAIGRRAMEQQYAELMKHVVNVSFIPHGDNRYGLDVYFSVVPIEHGQGFTWSNTAFQSHEEFIAEYNQMYAYNPELQLHSEDYILPEH